MFDVIKHYEKVSPELVEKFSKFEESASIHESMGRTGAMGGKIHPVWPGSRICGTAVTVEARPGDNLIVHKAIDMLKPGDVLMLETEIIRVKGPVGVGKANAYVDGKLVCKAELTFALGN